MRESVLQAYIAEFESLRAEIHQRSEFQHRFVLLCTTATGAILSWALQQRDPSVTLALPPLAAATALFWVWHGLETFRIGAYLREVLAKNVKQIVGVNALGWEDFLSDRYHGTRDWTTRLASTSAVSLVFVGTAAIGLIGWPIAACLTETTQEAMPWLMALWITDCAFTVLAGYVYYYYGKEVRRVRHRALPCTPEVPPAT